MSKFKVGDRVRIVNTRTSSTKKFIGDVVTIEKLSVSNIDKEPCYYVTGEAGFHYKWFDDELELVKLKFNINDYPGNCVMHVTTEKQDEIFRKYLHSLGRTWSLGQKYIEFTYFGDYENNTCYEFNQNKYSNLTYFLDGYRILEFDDFDWSDFMKKEFTKADLKNGDVVKRRDGSVEILVSDLHVFVGDHGDYAEMGCINDDLTSSCGTNRDIIAVRRINCNYGNPFQTFQHEYGTLVYERKEVEEMTLEEVCKALGKEIKIVKK